MFNLHPKWGRLPDMIDTPDALFADLMRQSQAGDKVAYERLLRAIAPLIRSFFLRRIVSEHDVDDLLQNTLVAIHKASHTYNTNRSFMGWMFAIARYKLNDSLREHYRKTVVLDHSIDDDVRNTEYHVTNLPTASEHLTELLQVLPETQRQIVTLLKIEGYTIREAALRLNMSESAVKVAAHRAYKNLISQKHTKGTS